MTSITLRAALRLFFLLLALVLGLGQAPAQGQQQHTAPDAYAEALRLIMEQRLDEAAALLQHVVATQPQHAGALLDLAILLCTMGQKAEAARLLQALTARFAPPPAIEAVLAQLQALGCAAAQQQPAPAWALSLAHGYDSNANQGSRVTTLVLPSLGGAAVALPLAPEHLPQADHFVLFGAELLHPLPQLGNTGARGFVQAQARRHAALRQYDTAVLQLGVELPWQHQGWNGQVAAALSALNLGGQPYQHQARLLWLGQPGQALAQGLQWAATAELSLSRYPGLAHADSLSSAAGAGLEWRSTSKRPLLLRLSAGAALDQALGQRPGGNRNGWHGAVQASWPGAWAGSVVDAGLSRRVWRGAQPYAPGLIELPRDQTTDTLTLRLSLPLARGQAAYAELRRTRNRESIAVFSHDGQQLLLGWEWRSR